MPRAILIAAETTEFWDDEIDPEQLRSMLDFVELRVEALNSIRLIYRASPLRAKPDK